MLTGNRIHNSKTRAYNGMINKSITIGSSKRSTIEQPVIPRCRDATGRKPAMTGGGDDDGLGKPAYTVRAVLWEEVAGRCAVDCAEEKE